jgi:tellurite resistance protein
MATWLGSLANGGILKTQYAEAGVSIACFVVGEGRLSELREWMNAQKRDVVIRETQAAIEVCIWMANADRHLDPEESHLLQQIVLASELPEDNVDALIDLVHAPPSLADIEIRLTHPVLRELMLALAWELVLSDGKIDEAEKRGYEELAKKLGVRPGRADELRGALVERISALPS